MLKLLKIFFCLFGLTLFAQHIELLQHNLGMSLRGMSVVNDSVIWVSGSKGSIGKSTDYGKNFEWFTVKGFEISDFRDIEAFDQHTAVIMSIDAPAYILKTTDGGKNWKIVYENPNRAMFLDAMDFYDNKIGIVVGDPIANRVFLAKTNDGGETWKTLTTKNYPKMKEGEAFFASSGSNIKLLSKKKYVYVSGGKQSNLYKNTKPIPLTFITGIESNGANAIAVKDKNNWMIVGGDYTQKTKAANNVICRTKDGGKHFITADKSVYDYRSGVEYLSGNQWIICGLSGVDISKDNGTTWQNISQEGFHVCKKAKNGTKVYLAGNGKIGVLTYLKNE